MASDVQESLTARPPAKRRRNAAATRARILEMARQEFADRGFDGARLDKIARAAKVNIALLYHYFGNKEGLFVAVLEEAYRTMRDYEGDTIVNDPDPLVAMTGLVRARFRIFLENPELIGVLNAANVHKAAHMQQSDFLRTLYQPLVGQLADLLRRGEAQGVFRRGVNPTDLFITINAIGYFYLSNRYTLSYVLNEDLSEPARLQQREAHMVEVLLSYLRPPAEPAER